LNRRDGVNIEEMSFDLKSKGGEMWNVTGSSRNPYLQERQSSLLR
jgi:hypothetical protein